MLAVVALVQVETAAQVRPAGRPAPDPALADASAEVPAAVLEAQKSDLERFGLLANFYRLDEDWSAIRSRPDRRFPLSLKERRVGRRAWLSIGGDYRLRTDGYTDATFGLPGSERFTAVQNRFLLNADLEVGDAVRAFVQFSAATEDGWRPGPPPGTRSGPDVAQAFLELAPPSSPMRWRVRAGRQEFVLTRYISIREGPNLRQAFDGVRLDAAPNDWTLTGFVGRPVVNRTGAFDDAGDRGDRVVALSAAHPVGGGLQMQGLFIDRRFDRATYAQAHGSENRRTYSALVTGSGAPWSVQAQASYQGGSLRGTGGVDLRISAWSMSFQGELALPGRNAPRLGLRTGTASGDRRATDRSLGTFDVPYPDLAYLNDAAIFAPRNSYDVQPYVMLQPTRRLSLTLGDEVLWRARRGDAVYASTNLPIVGPGGGGRLIAHQPYLRSTLTLSPLLNVQLSYLHAFRGDVLRNGGATRDTDFLLTAIYFRF